MKLTSKRSGVSAAGPGVRVCTAAEHVLEATQLRKQFGGVAAVDDVSLALKAGNVLGLIGPNGAGKTTVLNMLSGVLSVDSGAITKCGTAIEHKSAYRRARLGIARTFQQPRLAPNLTIIENVMAGARGDVPGGGAEGGRYKRLRGRESRMATRAVELLDLLTVSPALWYTDSSVLPVGAQRWIEIARAMIAAPEFLLLDEPSSGFTREESQHLGTVLTTLREAGLGLCLVTHDVSLAFDVCDEICVLDRGRVVAVGTPTEIQNHTEVRRIYLGDVISEALARQEVGEEIS